MRLDLKKRVKYWVKSILPSRHSTLPIAFEKAEQMFYISYLQPGMIAFDVGANIGELSLLFSRFVGSEGRVHAFEASSATYQRLNQVIAAKGKSNITLNQIGVADTCGSREFFLYDEQHSGWSGMARRDLSKYDLDLKPVTQEVVPVTTVEQYCKDKHISRIDLLKVDVEGAELQVLQGAKNLFLEQKIAACVFETGETTLDMGNRFAEIYEFIDEVGYSVKSILPHLRSREYKEVTEKGCFSLHVMKPR